MKPLGKETGTELGLLGKRIRDKGTTETMTLDYVKPLVCFKQVSRQNCAELLLGFFIVPLTPSTGLDPLLYKYSILLVFTHLYPPLDQSP